MKVLIVEDSPFIMKIVEVTLKKHGYEVAMAKNGLEGLEAIKNHNDIGIIISDLMMPEMDGFQFISTIRKDEKYAAIPILITTALADVGNVARARALGVRHYLVKPILETQLISKMNQIREEMVQTQNIRVKTMMKLGLDSKSPDDTTTFNEIIAAFRQSLQISIEQLAKYIESPTEFSIQSTELREGLQLVSADPAIKQLDILLNKFDIEPTGKYQQDSIKLLDRLHEVATLIDKELQPPAPAEPATPPAIQESPAAPPPEASN